MIFSFILGLIWDVNPAVFPFSEIPRWYGVFFGSAFLITQRIGHHLFEKEGRNKNDADIVTIYLVLGVVLGARLGHVFFYDWDYYSNHLGEILMIWKGGLASHGAGIGMVTAIYLYARKRSDQSFLWVLDKVAIVTVVAGFCIRSGNMMNSEIIGKPTGANYGVVFVRSVTDHIRALSDDIEDVSVSKDESREAPKGETPMSIKVKFKRSGGVSQNSVTKLLNDRIKPLLFRYTKRKMINGGDNEFHIAIPNPPTIDSVVGLQQGNFVANIKVNGIKRHPAQMYEAFYCLIIFALLFYLWTNYRDKLPDGVLTGILFIVLFSLRFLDEFLKENQVVSEDSMIINLGQQLSIPYILVGIGLIIYGYKFNAASITKSPRKELK